MSNEEVRQFQFGCFFVVLMNGGMAAIGKFAGVPAEWWILAAGIAIMIGVFGLCTVMIRGWMPKDKLDWDGFAWYCHKHSKQKGEI